MRVRFKLKDEPEPFKGEPSLRHSIQIRSQGPMSSDQKERRIAHKLGIREEMVECNIES